MKKKTKVNELIEHLSVQNPRTTPVSDMVTAVGEATSQGDKNSLVRLIRAIAERDIRLNPNISYDDMTNNAYKLLLTCAYFADHNPDSNGSSVPLNPKNAYSDESRYGANMRFIKSVCDDQQIGVADILRPKY